MKRKGVTPQREPLRFRPNPGQQERYFRSEARIVIAGGQAGGGKTMALLMDSLRGLEFPGYEAALFRKTLVQHKMRGGLRAESKKYYPKAGGDFNKSELLWSFPNECSIQLLGCDEPSKFDGLQVAFLGVDQLEQLEAEEFWHLCSRTRSTCGAPIRIRATCNPEPGWLEKFLKSGGFVGQDGFPVDEMDGIVRWFIRSKDSDEVFWSDSVEGFGKLSSEGKVLAGPHKGLKPDSLTFIRFKLTDNPHQDPDYEARLQQLTIVERRKKLDGNWNQWSGGGGTYRAAWWGLVGGVWNPAKTVLEGIPFQDVQMCWAWDIGWSHSGDWSVGILFGQDMDGWLVLDAIRFRAKESVTFEAIRRCAAVTGRDVPIALPKDPGKAGLDQEGWQVELGRDGFQVHLVPDDGGAGDKVARHRFLSPQAERGHLRIVPLWRPTREVSRWISTQEGKAGRPVECTTVDEWAREFVENMDALGDGCPHSVTDWTDPVARAHRFLTGSDPIGASKLASAMMPPSTWQPNEKRTAVAMAASSEWARVRPGGGGARKGVDWLTGRR